MSGHAPGGGVTPRCAAGRSGYPSMDASFRTGSQPWVATKHPSSFPCPIAILCGARAAGHSSEVGIPLAAGSEIRQLGVGFTIVCPCGARLGWSSRLGTTAEVFVSVALWTDMLIKHTAHTDKENRPSSYSETVPEPSALANARRRPAASNVCAHLIEFREPVRTAFHNHARRGDGRCVDRGRPVPGRSHAGRRRKRTPKSSPCRTRSRTIRRRAGADAPVQL